MGQVSSKKLEPLAADASVKVVDATRKNRDEFGANTSANAVSKVEKKEGSAVVAEGKESKECPWKPWWMKQKTEGKDASDQKAACPIAGVKKNEALESSPAESENSACPVVSSKSSTSGNERTMKTSACPVAPKGHGSTTVYNVYSQPIDPSNQMPASSVINQLPGPHQTVELSTERSKSSIPKGGGGAEGTTWTYPSPQMFYNALARKGKLSQSVEQNQEEQSMMETVVALHNNMNEMTWNKVLEWEQLVSSGGGESDQNLAITPKLLKFCGRPSELSPKARLKYWLFGHPLPFDRHDWTIVRPNGEEVRYVIDYYYKNEDEDNSNAREEEISNLEKNIGSRQILVDVRPAMDGPQAMYMRSVVMPMARRGLHPLGTTSNFDPLPVIPDSELKRQVEESENTWKDIQAHGSQLSKMLSTGGPDSSRVEELEEAPKSSPTISKDEAKSLAESFARVIGECQKAQKAVDAACRGNDDAACAQASLQLTMCVAKIVCPVQHQAVAKSVHSTTDNQEEYDLRVDTALENATLCIGGVNERILHARNQHPEAFKDVGK